MVLGGDVSDVLHRAAARAARAATMDAAGMDVSAEDANAIRTEIGISI